MHALLIVEPSKLYCSPVGTVWQYAIGNVKNADERYNIYIYIYIYVCICNGTYMHIIIITLVYR